MEKHKYLKIIGMHFRVHLEEFNLQRVILFGKVSFINRPEFFLANQYRSGKNFLQELTEFRKVFEYF